MIEFLKRMFGSDDNAELESTLNVQSKPAPLRPAPGKALQPNDVIRRRKIVREDTGTHETLKIVDDELQIADDKDGIDPYNTGGFDRSKNWDSRFRK